ncbi:MAG: LamG-like jellyroll fold domain-containing protein [Candidatus Anammoxibacter sp.]
MITQFPVGYFKKRGEGIVAATSYSFDGDTGFLSIGDNTNFKWMHGADNITAFKFTFSCWLKMNSFGDLNTLMTTSSSGSGNPGVMIRLEVNRTMQLFIGNNTVGQWLIGDLFIAGFPDDTINFHHVEVSYDQSLSSNNYKLFIDGILKGAATKRDYTPVTNNSYIELRISSAGAIGALDGFMDDIHITDIIEHTTDFTPADKQLEVTANTRLLINCGEPIVSGITGSGATFNESSVDNFLVTENNTVIRDTTIFKF